MPPTRPHLILLGGFLGAGKTTAMLALGDWLADQGIRPAFITNDQAGDLVDTQLLQFCGHAAEEIAGGCFCCRFDELVGATRRLRGVLRPDVFVAEAVGSCTDLAATVTSPMRRLLSEECTVAPLSVVIDPVRAREVLGLDEVAEFSDDVRYIYRKQLEEADAIVINKCELLEKHQHDELIVALRAEFPRASLFAVSARERVNLDEWFRHIVFNEQPIRPLMDVDYDRYADGEARLGWLNARVALRSTVSLDGNALLQRLVEELRRGLVAGNATVAHLKMVLEAESGVAAINLVRSGVAAEPGVRLAGDIRDGRLTINLRAEADPALLEHLLREAVAAIGAGALDVEHVEAFRPGRPVPTHRDTSAQVTPPNT